MRPPRRGYDLVEDGRAVSLKRMPQGGECGVECKTLALACADTMAEARRIPCG